MNHLNSPVDMRWAKANIFVMLGGNERQRWKVELHGYNS